ncbi:hypothetical protein JAAARDRAFT_675241 [Jaapia argillacea MUCL 33604]|uniref:Uncharacterized protein n=1 Tax=Jaapia argillacea MUCL 33604 TaxID=933084 RepID=A0A067PV95_9AGAM|nr:hypothetical protein JAAARDRAFT_675241 [Jaapia argillacea MUCL 33604]
MRSHLPPLAPNRSIPHLPSHLDTDSRSSHKIPPSPPELSPHPTIHPHPRSKRMPKQLCTKSPSPPTTSPKRRRTHPQLFRFVRYLRGVFGFLLQPFFGDKNFTAVWLFFREHKVSRGPIMCETKSRINPSSKDHFRIT